MGISRVVEGRHTQFGPKVGFRASLDLMAHSGPHVAGSRFIHRSLPSQTVSRLRELRRGRAGVQREAAMFGDWIWGWGLVFNQTSIIQFQQ